MFGYNKKINENKLEMFDNNIIKIIIISCILIILSVLFTGTISYVISRNAVVEKLKSNDLKYICQSITSKIEGRIDRAKETSLVLSRDPVIIKWIEGKEEDKALGSYVKEKITDIAKNYGYNNSFIVSALTRHYWAENGKLDTVSKKNHDDSWFFSTIKSGQAITISIDYNKERKNTFMFFNQLIGKLNNPIGVTGVGLSLKDISKEFNSYKFGDRSNMWLTDATGKIYLSEDVENINKNIGEYIPKSVKNKIVQIKANKISNQMILEYNNEAGETYDLICMPIKSANLKLVLQIPRSESIAILNSIKTSTAVACFITIVLLTLLFYFVSNKIANPYKRALQLSEELEKKVNERTLELNEKNTRIMDSIEYAKIIQESILPPLEILNDVFKEHFILWRPKDIVGGDFYLVKKLNHGYIVTLGDCTGHGVPGALMTMAVNSILDHILDGICSDNPAIILKEMNLLLKKTLYGRDSRISIDDGLDACIIYISNAKKRMIFAGAKISAYIKNKNELNIIHGNNKGIGYRRTSDDYVFNNHELDLDDEAIIYLTTDGYMDQNGGEKDYPLGRKRFEELILKVSNIPLHLQKETFELELVNYMNKEAQRDDITVLAFKI